MRRTIAGCIVAAGLAVWVAQQRQTEGAEDPAAVSAAPATATTELERRARNAAREEAAHRKRMKIGAVIARLGAEGISRGDLKEYFWDEIAEEVRDDPDSSDADDGFAREYGR